MDDAVSSSADATEEAGSGFATAANWVRSSARVNESSPAPTYGSPSSVRRKVNQSPKVESDEEMKEKDKNDTTYIYDIK